MPRVRIIYDEPGWAYHRKALALARYAPADFDITLALMPEVASPAALFGEPPVDLLFYMPDRAFGEFKPIFDRRRGPPVVVGHWSVGWPYKRDAFDAHYAVLDAMVCTNAEYSDGLGPLDDVYTISNGVDLETFFVTTAIESRPHKVLWTGSEFHRRLKGYDDFIQPLAAELTALGIDCDLRLVDSMAGGKYSADEMADWYNSGTVLVCASDTEGTPNPALEAAACGCTLVSTPVGNMPELIVDGVNGYLVERDIAALKRGVLSACANYPALARRMRQDIRDWHWRDRAETYFRLFRELIAAEDRACA